MFLNNIAAVYSFLTVFVFCQSAAAGQYIEYKNVLISEYVVWPDAYSYGVAKINGEVHCYFGTFDKNLYVLLEKTAASAKEVDVTCQQAEPISLDGNTFDLKLTKINPIIN